MSDKDKKNSAGTDAFEKVAAAVFGLGGVFAVADAITENKPEKALGEFVDLDTDEEG